MGGLDKNLSTGESALYWANSTMEVMFHEIVAMPTIESDPQQIQKVNNNVETCFLTVMQKRHVGNDFVHIIWSEHLRDYNPLTITSQFNEAHIIIYPLANGLFRIQTYRLPTVCFYLPSNLLNQKDISIWATSTWNGSKQRITLCSHP